LSAAGGGAADVGGVAGFKRSPRYKSDTRLAARDASPFDPLQSTATEVREWLQAALHRTELGEDLLEFVLRHTEGNPFLVMQLLRTMLEENVFSYSGSAWVWTIPETLVLPAGMSDLVGRRLSRLPRLRSPA